MTRNKKRNVKNISGNEGAKRTESEGLRALEGISALNSTKMQTKSKERRRKNHEWWRKFFLLALLSALRTFRRSQRSQRSIFSCFVEIETMVMMTMAVVVRCAFPSFVQFSRSRWKKAKQGIVDGMRRDKLVVKAATAAATALGRQIGNVKIGGTVTCYDHSGPLSLLHSNVSFFLFPPLPSSSSKRVK